MNLESYTGKLNTHESYIEILNKIEPKCKYIEMVILDGRELIDNEITKNLSLFKQSADGIYYLKSQP